MLNLYKCFDHWSKQGTVWIYSDTHFGDKELQSQHPRPYSDEEILKRINSKVGKKDTFIHLGDVGDVDFAKRIKGYKILICGNHDSGRSNYEGIFDEIYEGPLVIAEKFILSHEPLDVPWAFNIHGHDHAGCERRNHLNCCADVVDYMPINLNQFMKTGPAAHVYSVHRETIDKATERKKKREGKKYVSKKK